MTKIKLSHHPMKSWKALVGVLVILCAITGAQAKALKPNFLVFITDDQGFGDMGCYGARDIATPHMDKLAAQGARFTQWYANAPVCAPTRASFLTGRYPRHAGVPNLLKLRSAGLGLNQLTLPQVLKSAGYRTGLVGKWHLGGKEGYRPNQRGFDDFFGFLEGNVDYFSHLQLYRSKKPLHDLWRNRQRERRDGEYMTDLITRESQAFLEKHRGAPFFLYVAYNAPHYPLHAPKKYFDRFRHLPKQRQTYAALLAAVDDSLGELLHTLDQLDLAEDTFVVFMSDNGPFNEARNFLEEEPDKVFLDSSAGPYRGHKGSLFEGGTRIPALMRWPGRIPNNSVVRDKAITMDLFPTIAKLAGVTLPEDYAIDGKDILSLLQGKAPSPHQTLFWEYRNQSAVLEGKWKLILKGKLDFARNAESETILIDLEDDPGETNNLAACYPEKVKQLKDKYHTWKEEMEGKRAS